MPIDDEPGESGFGEPEDAGGQSKPDGTAFDGPRENGFGQAEEVDMLLSELMHAKHSAAAGAPAAAEGPGPDDSGKDEPEVEGRGMDGGFDVEAPARSASAETVAVDSLQHDLAAEASNPESSDGEGADGENLSEPLAGEENRSEPAAGEENLSDEANGETRSDESPIQASSGEETAQPPASDESASQASSGEETVQPPTADENPSQESSGEETAQPPAGDESPVEEMLAEEIPGHETTGEALAAEEAQEEAAASGQPTVTAIVLNYNASLEKMNKCLSSLERQTWPGLHILLVDNASTDDILESVARDHPGIAILALDRNYGFSGGINRGIAYSADDYICLLNFDTVVEPDFVAELVAVAESDPDIAGVAPKMLFADHPHIFDSVGTAMADNAGAFNQAIGQPDIGQYDVPERVFGACFGAALMRRQEFEPERVGRLDESYFMYFEDVDWCFRANLLGLKFYTAPAAVVYHEHSASIKDRGYDYKYKLIELNLLRTVVKNYQRRQMVRICARRLRTHLENSLRNGNGRRLASIAIITGFLSDLRGLMPKRWEVQRRRRVRDLDILHHSFNELPYYDPTVYQPIYSLETLAAAYRRLYALHDSDRALRIWRGLEALSVSKLKFEEKMLRPRLQELLAGEPEHVREFAAHIRPE